MKLHSLLAPGFAALLGATTFANALELSEVDVTADLTVIEDPQAATFWGSLETDLEAAVLALVADMIAEDGARLVINIEAFSIDDEIISTFNLSDAALVGKVHVVDDNNNANFQSFELSVAVEGLNATNEDGTPILTAQMESEQAYEILIAAFAENVVEALD